jgi:hypothetical protein
VNEIEKLNGNYFRSFLTSRVASSFPPRSKPIKTNQNQSKPIKTNQGQINNINASFSRSFVVTTENIRCNGLHIYKQAH